MIERAVEILRAGGLVAFPTETVYGLGADARNADAVAKIFAVKGRPATNPLIVHVHSVRAAKRWSREWIATADKLAERFWPGPLTLVVPKSRQIADAVTAGGDTVGLRVPNHPLALELLEAFDGPVAAPSANRSNRISPTSAEHVRQELGHQVDLILDGGNSDVGIESTVLDLTSPVPAILRPGRITRSELERLIGKVESRSQHLTSDQTAASPGQQVIHYAPKTMAWWCLTEHFAAAHRLLPKPLAAMRCRSGSTPAEGDWVVMPESASQFEQQFYRELRLLDQKNAASILIELPPDASEWLAVRDRIMRAARRFEHVH